jgi:hypothetical protein
MPQAGAFQYDVVKYFWLNLSQFDDTITMFISTNKELDHIPRKARHCCISSRNASTPLS